MLKIISVVLLAIGTLMFIGGLMGMFHGAIFHVPQTAAVGGMAIVVSVLTIWVGIYSDLKYHNLA